VFSSSIPAAEIEQPGRRSDQQAGDDCALGAPVVGVVARKQPRDRGWPRDFFRRRDGWLSFIDRIEEQSKELLEKPNGPLDELEKLWPEDEVDGNLFRLGRRLFYHRAQQILDIMHPGREAGVSIDLIWQYCESEIPGAVVSNALCDGENINGHCLSVIEAREAHEGPFGTYSQNGENIYSGDPGFRALLVRRL